MSRIGKQAIAIPPGVKVEQKGRHIKVTGPLGNLEMGCHPEIKVKIDGSSGKIYVKNDNPEERRGRQLHGTMRSLIANMVTGVSMGFTKKMEVYGTGYNVKVQGNKLVLQVGFCHPVEMAIPGGIKVAVEVGATRGNETPAKFTISGTDKSDLGQFAAEIRKQKPPEPYKGKGIRYAEEVVRRKAGKAFTSGTV
ncbi:MAG: 50S ribosomal protein L6 [Planctomycetota bacterium]|jgi:large subunit ribosomal protein L6